MSSEVKKQITEIRSKVIGYSKDSIHEFSFLTIYGVVYGFFYSGLSAFFLIIETARELQETKNYLVGTIQNKAQEIIKRKKV